MPFFRFLVKDKSCLTFLLVSGIITVIYFILLRVLYPVGSFDHDSCSYIEAALLGLEVNMRPLGYSYLISFFRAISRSDELLILVQYISNVIANLFLFFTLLYFFPLKKTYRVVLFILLMCNPLYVLYSNCIMSDAFFCSFSVMWLTLLLWIIYQPHWINFFIQMILLYWLFLIRSNAIIYPFIVAVAYFLSEQSLWKKITFIVITFLVIAGVMHYVTNKTKEATGIATFSAFGGWQLANNSIFVLKHVKFDSAAFKTKTSKELCAFIQRYYDSLKTSNPVNHHIDINFTSNLPSDKELDNDTTVSPVFIWRGWSPLNHYMRYYLPQFYAIHPPSDKIVYHKIASWNNGSPIMGIIKKQPQYGIASWTAMGPVLEEFGTEVIKKYPFEYLRYFVWPNIKLYFYPPVENYKYYNENLNTFCWPVITAFYNYTSNEIDQSHSGLLYTLMSPWDWLFPIINILFILLTIAYYFKQGFKNDGLFNRCFIFYITFFLTNFLFNVATAPTYFRYHITVVTLSIPFIVYLWQRVFSADKKTVSVN